MKTICKTCQDKRKIEVNTIAGKLLDYCPDCNFGNTGKSWRKLKTK